MIRTALLLTAIGILSGCASPKPNTPDTMTRRQKDSAIGQSGLPGAQGINKALRAADSTNAQTARIDSAAKQP